VRALAGRIGVFAAIVAVALLVAHAAWPARAPNWVKKSLTYKGDPARALAALLQLPADRRAVVQLELSQATELSALPERDKALRDPDGTLSSELGWRTSSLVHETVTWDPAAGVLGFEGYMADRITALPAQGGLAWSFTSPAFAEAEVDALPGWKPLLPKLAALPAKAMSGGALMRRLVVLLDGVDHASLELWRIQTWDSKNQPVPRSFITMELGPPLPAPRYVSNNEGSGGSRACGCRAGPADGGSLWALGAAAASVVRRRRRRATSRTRPRASRAPRSPVSAPDS